MAVVLVTAGPISFTAAWAWQNQPASGNVTEAQGYSYTGTQQTTGTSTAGTVAGVVDLKYSARLTITTSGNTLLDLTNLADPVFGGTLNFARIKEIFVCLPTLAVQASSILLGNAGSNPWSSLLGTSGVTDNGTVTLNKGCLFHVGFDPGAVGYITGGSNKVLKILNNDGSHVATVDVGVIGNST